MKTNMILLAIVVVGLWWMLAQDEPSDSMEQQLATVLQQVENVGQVDVFMYRKEEGGLLFETTTTKGEVGVLIVAEGATSEHTKRLLIETVSAVLDIPPHQIKVLPLVKEEP